MDDFSNFLLSGSETDRLNCDKHGVNNYGRELIELCKALSMFTANGAAGKNRYEGRPTTKHDIVIDCGNV